MACRRRGLSTFAATCALMCGTLSVSSSSWAWTIDQAVRQALVRAPELRAAHALRDEALGRLEQLQASYWPAAEAEVGYRPHWPENEIRLPALAAATGGSSPKVDDVHRFQAALKLSYRAVDLARGARVDAATASVDQSAAAEQVAAVQLAYRVRKVFLAALHARDVARIARESLVQARREQRRARLRLEAGVGTEVGLAQARVRRAELEAQLARAAIGLRRQRQLLGQLIGARELPQIEGDLRAEGGTGTPENGGAEGSGGAQDTALSLRRNPALRQLEAGSRAAQLRARSAGLGWVPTLSLLAAGGWMYPRALQLELGPYVEGAVVLRWDIFDGFQRTGREREARAQSEQLHQRQRALHDDLERQMIDVEARQLEAHADLQAAETALQENQIYLRVARAAVQAGTGTELDEHQAELNLDRARMAVQRALLNTALTRAERWLVLGKVWAPPSTKRAEGGQK